MDKYLVVAVRIVTLIPWVLIMTLIMGKRQVGELPIFDFVIAIILGAVVGADIADPNVGHGPTAFAVLFLALIQVVVSRFGLKHLGFRRLIRFEPTIVIQNGKILKHNLRKIRYSLDQITELLRLQGVFNLSEVEYALVEPNGKVSVLKKSQKDYVRAEDLGVDTPYRGLPTTVIYDGNIDREMLGRLNLDEKWLQAELAKLGVSSAEEVFYAELDTAGNLYVSLIEPDVAEDKKLV